MLEKSVPEQAERGACAARVAQVCDAVGEFVAYWGFKAIHGRIWAFLALRRRPVAQADIAKQLGVSRALVSSAMAELGRYNLVRPVSSARNAPYEAVIDVWPTITHVLRGREWMLVEQARLALEAALEEVQVAERGGEVSPYSAERIAFLLNMTELAQAWLKLLIGLRAPKAFAGLRRWASKASTFVQAITRGQNAR